MIQYHTVWSQSQKTRITRKILTKIENILTNYFVTKADSNYETNRKKILLNCPFKKDSEKSHDSAQYDTVQNLTPCT